MEEHDPAKNKPAAGTSIHRVTPLVNPILGKRKHSDSDENSFCSSGESESLSQGSSSPYRSRSSESPGGDDVPSRTSSWIEEKICNRLQIECRECRDPYSLFIREYVAMKKDSLFCNSILESFPMLPTMSTDEIVKDQKELIENSLETIDQAFKMNCECFEYVLNSWDALDCEFIYQINVSHALKMVRELEHFKGSSLSSGEWLKRKNFEKKPIVLETCHHIFHGLKLFYDQLLFMMNRSHSDNPVTERMFQDLFLAFIRIFGLKICDTTNTEHYFTLGGREVISEPDAIIYKFKESESSDASTIESSAFVVVEVKKYYSKAKEEKERTHNLRNASKTTKPVAAHVNSSLKGQHIGEMIAVTQSSSAFGKNGVFGFIVQGTKVTLVSLEVSGDFFENTNMKGKVKRTCGIVRYSKECNILVKRGRRELIPVLLSMATLFKND